MSALRILSIALALACSAFWAASPASASPTDIATACGAFFLTQANQLGALPNNAVAPMLWLATTQNNDFVKVDLLVFRPNGTARFTGFACSIGKNGALAPIGAQAPVPVPGSAPGK